MFPNVLLQKLYTIGSLENTGAGARFALKNRLMDAQLTAIRAIAIDGQSVPLDRLHLDLEDGRALHPEEIDAEHPLPFPVRCTVAVQTEAPRLPHGKHEIEIDFDTKPFGRLHFTVQDEISDDGAGVTQPGEDKSR